MTASVLLRLSNATSKFSKSADSLIDVVEKLTKQVNESQKRAAQNKNGKYDQTVSLTAREDLAIRGAYSERIQRSIDTITSQLLGGIVTALEKYKAEGAEFAAELVDDHVSISEKTDAGLRRVIEEAGRRIDKRNAEKKRLLGNSDDKTRDQEFGIIRQANILDQQKAIEAGRELQRREELERLEAQSQMFTKYQEQTNKLIGAEASKEAIPEAIEKAKTDCSCIERAFEKYFGGNKLPVLCCDGSDKKSSDKVMVGGTSDNMLLGNAGNDPLYGGGFSTGYDLSSQYALYGMGQEALRNNLVQDPRGANDNAQEIESIYKNLSGTIGSSFSTMFEDILIRGQSFKESFAGLLGNIAGSIQNAIFGKIGNLISGSFSNFSFDGLFSGLSSIFSFFSFANGGVMSSAGPLPMRAYARGGIANSPQLALFGEGAMNEAYVPLPDGRRIPVNMNMEGKSSNQSGNVYQITQNVTVQGSPGQSQQESDRVAAQMMQSLDRAMTEKIDDRIRQSQRVGGISNPLRRIA